MSMIRPEDYSHEGLEFESYQREHFTVMFIVSTGQIREEAVIALDDIICCKNL